MLTLIVTVVLGLGFAIFATQNTHSVDIFIQSIAFRDVPLYLVVFISLMTGVLAALFIHVVKDLSSSLTISEKKDEIKKLRDELAEMTKKAHKLELENTKLKSKNNKDEFDEDSIQQ